MTLRQVGTWWSVLQVNLPDHMTSTKQGGSLKQANEEPFTSICSECKQFSFSAVKFQLMYQVPITT